MDPLAEQEFMEAEAECQEVALLWFMALRLGWMHPSVTCDATPQKTSRRPQGAGCVHLLLDC